MFKKSTASSPPNLFEGISQHVSSKKRNKLEDAQAWQNCFYDEITSRIDEELFSVLFVKNNGRPNAPVRQLVAMLVLKEGNDWTDEQLLEACDFNVLVLRALGLSNLSDQAPCRATYYNFKLSLLEHQKSTGVDLLEQAFQLLTKDQILRYKVSGTTVRMDTKLLQSNVAKTTRLQLALGVLIKFYKSLSPQNKSLLDSKQKDMLETIKSKSAEQHTYKLNKQKAADRLQEVATIVFQLVQLYEGMASDEYDLLCSLWTGHFELVEQDDDQGSGPRSKDMTSQGGGTLQSAHDPEAAYRNKAGSKKQVITGFVTNITDLCSIPEKDNKDAKLNLITDVQTQPANTPDTVFLPLALESTRAVVKDEIEHVLTDGGYHCQSNIEVSQNEQTPFKWYITAMQGTEGNYDFEQIEEGRYLVTDRRTNDKQETYLTSTGKYRIVEHHAKSRYRYFTKRNIINYTRRKDIESNPKWVSGLRANGEATIHQVFCKLNGMKTRYRGKIKHHQYALTRCFWVNFKRINTYRINNTQNVEILIRDLLRWMRIWLLSLMAESKFNKILTGFYKAEMFKMSF